MISHVYVYRLHLTLPWIIWALLTFNSGLVTSHTRTTKFNKHDDINSHLTTPIAYMPFIMYDILYLTVYSSWAVFVQYIS